MTTSTPARRIGQYAPIPTYRWVPAVVLLGLPVLCFLVGVLLGVFA